MANFMLSTITCKQTIIECFATDQEGKQKICDALDSGSALERYFVKKNIFNIWRGLLETSSIFGEVSSRYGEVS